MSTMNDLPCQELVELVTEYVEGALLPDERRRFEAHLAECDGCDGYLAQMRTTIVLTGSLHEHDVDPRALARLTAAFRDFDRTHD